MNRLDAASRAHWQHKGPFLDWDNLSEALRDMGREPMAVALAAADAVELTDAARYRRALDMIDRLDPKDFMGGQNHLPPAFREADVGAAFREVCRIVNGVLHGADAQGEPLTADALKEFAAS